MSINFQPRTIDRIMEGCFNIKPNSINCNNKTNVTTNLRTDSNLERERGQNNNRFANVLPTTRNMIKHISDIINHQD